MPGIFDRLDRKKAKDLRVDYVTGSKKIKSLGFMFTQPLIKRLMMSEFPTLGWKNAINKALKNKRKAAKK